MSEPVVDWTLMASALELMADVARRGAEGALDDRAGWAELLRILDNTAWMQRVDLSPFMPLLISLGP